MYEKTNNINDKNMNKRHPPKKKTKNRKKVSDYVQGAYDRTGKIFEVTNSLQLLSSFLKKSKMNNL